MVTLPNEYQEVEYIESTGTQYIVTDLVPTLEETDELLIRLAYTVLGKIQIFYGTNNKFFSGSHTVQGVLHTSNNNSVRHDLVPGSQSYEWFAPPQLNIPFEYHTVGKQATCLGVTRTIADETSSNKTQMNLFCQGSSQPSTFSSMRLYSVYYKRDGEYLLNLIPCYRKSDSEIGMFDLVSGTFYTNAGTGTFLKGGNVSHDCPNMLDLRRRVLLTTPHLETAQGTVASFSTDLKSNLKECKIHFSPIQSGTGDPSPSNVRPISGWDGVTIFHNTQVPPEYQEVEYIEATGTQYFWADIDIQDGLTVDSVQTITRGSDSYLFGGRGDSNTASKTCFNGGYGGRVQGAYPDGYYNCGTVTFDNIEKYHIVTIHSDSRRICTVDGTEVANVATDAFVTTTGKCLCFGWNKTGTPSNLYKGKVYSLKVSKADTLLANYIPCYRKSDNEPGMYDTVSGNFYTNEGTGEFLVGNDITDGEAYTIPFPQTIYGGYVDLVKGEVWKSWDVEEYDGTESGWKAYSSQRVYYRTGSKYHYSDADAENAKIPPVSNMFYGLSYGDAKSNSWPRGAVFETWDGGNGGAGFLPDFYETGSGTSPWIAFLSEQYNNGTPLALAYRLRTPTLITTLTPTQLKVLKGQNNIWSNANGNITVSYFTH